MEGIEINKENTNDIRYADNTALVADSESILQDIADKIVTVSKKFGLAFYVIKHIAWLY